MDKAVFDKQTLIGVAVIALVILVPVMMFLTRDTSSYSDSYTEQTGSGCPYIKVAADSGDYQAQLDYEAICE
jgi:hypothetical protein